MIFVLSLLLIVNIAILMVINSIEEHIYKIKILELEKLEIIKDISQNVAKNTKEFIKYTNKS